MGSERPRLGGGLHGELCQQPPPHAPNTPHTHQDTFLKTDCHLVVRSQTWELRSLHLPLSSQVATGCPWRWGDGRGEAFRDRLPKGRWDVEYRVIHAFTPGPEEAADPCAQPPAFISDFPGTRPGGGLQGWGGGTTRAGSPGNCPAGRERWEAGSALWFPKGGRKRKLFCK